MTNVIGCSGRESVRPWGVMRVVLLVAITGAVFGLGAGGAYAATCESPVDKGIVPEKTVSVETEGGSEVTEHYGNSAYSVTRCHEDGRLEISQTVAPISVPGGGEELVPFSVIEPDAAGGFVATALSYGDADEPFWAAQWQQEGQATLASVIPPTPEIPGASIVTSDSASGGQSAGSSSLSVVDKCSNNDWSFLTNAAWEHARYIYFVHWASIPGSNAQKDEGRYRIIDGHSTWNNTSNNCSYSDEWNAIATHAGDISRGVSTSADGFNVIDFGSMSAISCSGALACTKLRFSGAFITEADVRYSNGHPWYFGASGYSLPSTQYDLMSFAQHEAGHELGLGDIFSTCHLVMGSPCSGIGEWTRRWMGAGDTTGYRTKYPHTIRGI